MIKYSELSEIYPELDGSEPVDVKKTTEPSSAALNINKVEEMIENKQCTYNTNRRKAETDKLKNWSFLGLDDTSLEKR